jgi:hypothetical protein
VVVKAKAETDEDLLETFKGWFKQVSEVESDQRKRETEDLRYQVAEFQWDTKARAERLGKDGTPGRPTLSISLTKQPMQLVKNQAANADLGVEIHAVSEKADKEIAEAQEGLYRRIERDSNAALHRLWAFDRALQCGRGFYQVVTQWDEDGDDEFDQEIVIKRILDGSCVGLDPSAQEPDYSDAQWGYLDEWMTLGTFSDEYPDSKIAGLGDEDFADLAGNEPAWVMGSEGKRAVRVPQVWRKKHNRQSVCVVKDGRQFATVPKAEVGKRKIYATKTRDDITLCWYRITARDILDREEYEGLRLIPLIPVIWTELQPFDGERRYEGMNRPARDGQRAFNFAISAAVEDVGRLSKVPYIGPAGAFEGHTEKWDSINIRNWSYVEYNSKTGSGEPLEKPEPMPIDGTKLGLSLQLAEMAKGLVQSATAVYDPSLGKPATRNESGRKVVALQQQADASTSNGLEYLARLTLNYEARVVRERMPYVYDRPGRITRILGEEDKPKVVMLNAPYSVGEDGQPQRVASRNVRGAKLIDFRQGKYSTAVTVGKSYQTKLQEGQAVWSQLMPNLPPEAQVILLPTVMRFMDTPGATDAADLMAKFRDAKFPGLVDNGEEGSTPDQLKAQLAGQQQQMQQMQQQLQQAMQALATDKAKHDAQVQIEQFKTQASQMIEQGKVAAQERIAEMNNAARIEVARIAAAKDAMNKDAELKEELLATGLRVQAEADATAVQNEHERRMQHETLAHEVGMASVQHAHASEQQASAQQAEQDQAAQGAKPAGGGQGTE